MRQQQDAGGGGEDEHETDQRFLDIRPAALAPGQQQGADACRQRGGQLGAHAVRQIMKHGIEVGQAGGDGAQRRHLGDRQVDENDAPPQHVDAQHDMRRQHQQAGGEGSDEQGPVECVHFKSLDSVRRFRRLTQMNPSAIREICEICGYADMRFLPFHFTTSRRASVSSNRLARSFAASLPPTVKGSTTAGVPLLAANQSVARLLSQTARITQRGFCART